MGSKAESNPSFTQQDLAQIHSKGLNLDEVLSQMDHLKRGFPFTKLNRPCRTGDGIAVVRREDDRELRQHHSEAALQGRTMKFVPASGAASRMFKSLQGFCAAHDQFSLREIAERAEMNQPDFRRLLSFVKNLDKFAFYDDLKSIMLEQRIDPEEGLTNGHITAILELILSENGLNYARLPKGLIKFHRYDDHIRTPFEEHLVEAAEYTLDKNQNAKIHFTVSPQHLQAVKMYLDNVQERYANGIRFDITLSAQKSATDTIAVDLNNQPFRNRNGELVFRPAGHGALIENLDDLRGDIVFIKNVDNVVPDRLKEATYLYKKLLCGYLVKIQHQVFNHLLDLSDPGINQRLLHDIFEFAQNELFIVPPEAVLKSTKEEKRQFLYSKLNRPLRVCGMVKNEGEPGGGPFWVEHQDGSQTLQIVEQSQVDLNSNEQRTIWESSTHFNPVDLVCGVQDYLGRPFNLLEFIDPDTGFISRKSKDGKELKALEVPGLWNGAMAYWNTIFVEVPSVTFSPVKTVFDLLRKEHQPT